MSLSRAGHTTRRAPHVPVRGPPGGSAQLARVRVGRDRPRGGPHGPADRADRRAAAPPATPLAADVHSIALYLTLLLTEGESYRATPNGWLVSPSPAQVRLPPVLEWGGPGVVALVGVGWLLLEWRCGRRRPPRPAGGRVPTGADIDRQGAPSRGVSTASR